MRRIFIALALIVSIGSSIADVRIKDISRFQGDRNNMLVGYGLVTGLNGTGDSAINQMTLQSVSNMLERFGILVDANQVRSRNVAVVNLTAQLPAFAKQGDPIDVKVTSLGDARSLEGGVLLMAELRGPDQEIYALAQGALSVGGIDINTKAVQFRSNYVTSGVIPGGGVVERELANASLTEPTVNLLLSANDLTTTLNVERAINESLLRSDLQASVIRPGVVALAFNNNLSRFRLLAAVQDLTVVPDFKQVVVVNEATGTVVAGANVTVSPVVLSHGSLRLSIGSPESSKSITRNPETGSFSETRASSNAELVSDNQVLDLAGGAKISEVVNALTAMRLSSREIITVLQGLKESGALHAELVIK